MNIRHYKCGHKHIPLLVRPKDFCHWKYTVGCDGDGSLCYTCWKSQGL